MSQPTVSVIIPVRNGGSTFARCLAAVQASRARPLELIVVDDGSTDDSVALARAAGARVLHTPEPGLGPARARNLAAAQACGEVLFFFDADVEIRADTIGRVAQAFADPSLAALFGSYDDAPGDPGFLSQYKNLFHHFVHQHGSEVAATFWSGCGAVRRAAFIAHGGFATRYHLPSIEDIELGYGLRRAGLHIRLDKSLLVKHLKRWTLGPLLHSDIVARGIPWTRLILREGAFLNDLNLQTHNRISVVLIFALLACLLLGGAFPWALAGASLAAALLVWLNWPLYAFFAQKRSAGFAWRVVPVHWLYYFYNGVSFFIGCLLHVLESEPRPGRSANFSKRAFALAMLPVLLAATLLRFHELGAKSMWLDELLEISVARQAPPQIVMAALSFGAMPLDYFVAHFALTLGEQDFWLRVSPAFASLLTVAVMYRFAGRLLGRTTGAVAAALLAVSAFQVQYAQEARPYALFGLFALSASHTLVRALRTNRYDAWLAYTATSLMCLFTHYFTIFLFAAHGLIALISVFSQRGARPDVGRLLRFAGAAGLVVLVFAATPTFLNVVDVGRYFALGLTAPASFSAPPELKPNRDTGPALDKSLFVDQLWLVLSGGGAAWQWLFLGLILTGFTLLLRRDARVGLQLAVLASVPVALTLAFLIHRGTFFAVRYITPSYLALAPPMGLAIAAVAAYLGRRPRLGWAVGALTLALPLAFSAQRVLAQYVAPKEDWRAAGAFVSANFEPGDSVNAPLGGSVLFHYAPRATPGRVDTVDPDALARLEGRLWVVVHPYIGPAQGSLLHWLAAQPSAVEYRIDEALSVFVVDPLFTRAETLARVVPPDRALTLSHLAAQHALIGDRTQAEALFHRALHLDDGAVYQAAYADHLRAWGRGDDAARYFMAALAKDPANTQALTGMGRLYCERGLWGACVDALSRVVQDDPQVYAAYYYLWQAYERLGDEASAVAARELASALMPELPEPP